MKYLTRDQILNADDIEFTTVNVPEWGGAVRVAMMTGRARDAYERQLMSLDGKTINADNLRARFLAHCLVDEKGELIFSEQDVLALGQKNGKVIARLFEEASEFNATSVTGMENVAKN